ncbi:hypothetical protein AB0D12_31850 [Streptomyces sp. NPDC048479]|uniref:hypothetical protein n=1 Tax=Streptomyces sp. NPDC048479 TaxID=3154725 RepID=UPI00341D5660
MDTYDLFYYPTGGGFEGRESRGTYPTRDEAIAACYFSDPADWKAAGVGRWVTDSEVITQSGRDYEEYSIDQRDIPEPVTGPIEVRIERSGERIVTVDSVEYAAAKDAGTLGTFLAAGIREVPNQLTVIDPDGDRTNLPLPQPE